MVNCCRQRAAQPTQVNRSQCKSVDRSRVNTWDGLNLSRGNLPLTSRLGDDGVPYLLHVRDHASSLLELRGMAPEHVHGHTFLRLPGAATPTSSANMRRRHVLRRHHSLRSSTDRSLSRRLASAPLCQRSLSHCSLCHKRQSMNVSVPHSLTCPRMPHSLAYPMQAQVPVLVHGEHRQQSHHGGCMPAP